MKPFAPKNHLFLLIDDDDEEHEIFTLALQSLGRNIEFEGFQDAQEAINQLQKEKVRPQCIFLDLSMPGMNGEECLKELRKIPSLDNVPIYIYSTEFSPRLEKEFLQEGAKKCILKPSTLSELMEVLKGIVQTPLNV